MTGKRGHGESTGPFSARKHATDIVKGDVDDPGSFIEGRVFSIDPRKNQYTLDIRLDSKALPAYLDVVIEQKLQKRLGEFCVGDRLRILLQGAQILPHSSAPSHVPAILRFREGITVLLVSRAGLQGEEKKIYQIWPETKTSRTKKRKQALTVDNSDVGWFSSPPAGDGYLSAKEGTLGTQAAAAAGNPEPSPHKVPSPSPDTPPASTSHPEVAHDTGPSPSVIVSAASSSSTKLPLTTATGRSHGTATYAYKTASSYQLSSPIHLPSVAESSSAAMSAIPPIPVPSTSREKSDRNTVWASPEPRNGEAASEGPPSGKQKSSRKKKREAKKLAAAAAATAAARDLAGREASPMPIESVPAVPTVQSTGAHDLPQRDNGQTKLEVDDLSTLADMLPEHDTAAQQGGERARSGEDVDDMSGVGEAEENLDDPALKMRAGLIANGWPYTALSEIRHSALMSIIGVVSEEAKEPTQSKTGDWCTCFSLLDPSVLNSFGGVLYTKSAGIKVNCFMRVEQWLPKPKGGDVVLLRQVKIRFWNDNLTGTCYPNTMQWAIYDPLTQEVSQPDPNLTNHRSHHPPIWHLVSQEIEYCAQLARWWTAVQRIRAERQGTAVQIGGGPIVAVERKHMQRQHLLISEADPNREPRGYFNCTVEILHGHANHVSDIYSIYVTDYTSKSGAFVDHSSEWCPASLADRVLRIEMWREKAVALAQGMNPGEYWSLDNVRMKVSSGGYMEGSLSEVAKARKLSTSDVDTNQHLRTLLQRKKVWEENDSNPHVFPHKLFSEVELQSIFDCTVEVLHAEYNAAGTSLLYITDYTERSNLATPPTALWSRGLPGRIVTLELQGQQSKMADKVETGAFFAVKHMRLIERIMGVGKVVGRIGGPDRLIHKLKANNPNKELANLLERKRRFKEEAETVGRSEGLTTIAGVLKSEKRVEKFRVRARVVGTFPLRLEDCVVRCCKGCSGQLPPSTDSCELCPASHEATPECENIFHLFLRLQDEHTHAQITVAVDQNSSILGGLTPDDVMSASGMDMKMIRDRLVGYIGNLEAVQAANNQGRKIEAKVPVHEFTIESWYVEDEEDVSSGKQAIAYGLM